MASLRADLEPAMTAGIMHFLQEVIWRDLPGIF